MRTSNGTDRIFEYYSILGVGVIITCAGQGRGILGYFLDLDPNSLVCDRLLASSPGFCCGRKAMSSWVWKHSTKNAADKKTAICGICSKKLSYHRTITNPANHLESQHNLAEEKSAGSILCFVGSANIGHSFAPPLEYSYYSLDRCECEYSPNLAPNPRQGEKDQQKTPVPPL